MRTIYSEQHRLRDARTELYGGELVQPFEKPSRAETVLRVLRESELGEISAPEAFSLEPVLAVHDGDYIAFLETAWQEWQDAGYAGEVIANVWPARRMQSRVPRFIDGKVGYYAMAAETSISEGTWAAALSSKDVALTGAKALLKGERGVFSLCRPPGHHAALDMYGGYCFLNNAAIAAQYLRDHTPNGLRSSISIFIMVTVPRISSIRATMCCFALCMGTLRMPFRIFSVMPMKPAPGRASDSTATIPCPREHYLSSGGRPWRMPWPGWSNSHPSTWLSHWAWMLLRTIQSASSS